MTINLRVVPHYEQHDEMAALAALIDAPDRQDPEGSFDLEGMQKVDQALDCLRTLCARAGELTLCSQAHGIPAEQICAALDEITATAVRVLARWPSA